MRLAAFCCSVAVCGLVGAQTPVPPEKPIIVMTEIGQIATTTAQLRVDVRATLTTNQLTTAIEIRELGNGAAFGIAPGEVPAMIKLIEEASIEASKGKFFSEKAGKLDVGVRVAEDRSWLLIKLDSTAPSSSAYLIDAKNSTQVIRLLAQASQVSDWFLAKLRTIQPQPFNR
jgi:hypothetical protein